MALRAVPAQMVSPAQLGQIVSTVASSGQWRPLVRFTAGHRWYCRLDQAGPDAARRSARSPSPTASCARRQYEMTSAGLALAGAGTADGGW